MKRNPDGTFPKGVSGNPGGTTLSLLRQAREKFGDRYLDLVDLAVRIAFGETPDGYKDIKPADRRAFAEMALNRIGGKPKEHVEISGGVTPEQAALLEALRMTPHERRLAQDSTAAEDDAAMDRLTDADADSDTAD